MDSLNLVLYPTPPFRLDLTALALRRRTRNIVDRWDGTVYRRVLATGDAPVELAVLQKGSCENPRLYVTVAGRLSAAMRVTVVRLLIRMLGLRSDLRPFYALAMHDRRLAPLVEQFRGLKPPRFPSVFEALVNAMACQQLSLTVGIELLNRLAKLCGPAVPAPGTPSHAFPGPQELLKIKPQTFRKLGFSYSKARNILGLSREIIAGRIDPEGLQSLGNQSAIERLLQLRGVGRWTAEYVLLRGLGRTDIFPGDDVGARNHLSSWLGRDRPLNYDGVRRVVRRWRPYAGLLYFHLLLGGLAESDKMPGGAGEQATA